MQKRIDDLNRKVTAMGKPGVSVAASSAVPKPPQESLVVSVPILPSEPTKNFEQQASGWLTKIGVTALVIGVALFLQYAISQGWVGIWGRLLLGLGVAVLMIILGDLWRNKYGEYATALSGGGVAIFTFTVYAAYAFYHVIPLELAFALIFLVAVLACALAYRYKSHILATLGIAIMYFAPVILGAQNVYFLLFFLLLLSTSALYIFRKIFAMEILYLTGLGFFINYFTYIDLFSAASVQFLSFVLLVVMALLYYVASAVFFRKHKENNTLPPDNTFQGNIDNTVGVFYLFFGIFFWIAADETLRGIANGMVSISLLAGAAIAFLAYMVIDRLEYRTINASLSLVGSVLAVAAVFYQFDDTKVITLGVMVVSLAILAAGQYFDRKELRLWGLIGALSAMMGAFIMSHDALDPAFINVKFGLEVLSMTLLAYGAYVYSLVQNHEFEKDTHSALMAIVAGALWLGVGMEIGQYYQVGSENALNLTISLWSLLYASFLAVIGGKPGLKILRKVSVVLFGFSILKVFLYDAFGLESGYRIASFIALGAILLIVSFGYQHNKEKIKSFLKE